MRYFFLLVMLSSLNYEACEKAIDSSRITSAGGSITEIIYFLEQESRLIAVDVTSNYPESALNLPSIGYVRALSAEGVLSLDPTLIIGENDMGPPSVIDQIKAGPKYLATLNRDDHHLCELCDSITVHAPCLACGIPLCEWCRLRGIDCMCKAPTEKIESSPNAQLIDNRLSNLVLLCRNRKLPGHLWFDTGCRRCVSGPDDHTLMVDALAKIGLKPIQVMKQEQFIFGDAKTATSDCAFAYPAFQNNAFAGLIDIARVHVPCPGLFSLKMAKRWQCITDHAGQQIIVQKYNRTWPFQNGTPVINVLDFEEDKVDLTDVPPEFFIE